jgi:hypothetical protein
MKRNEARKLKKLQLSKETLRDLTAPEIQMAMGGSIAISCQSNCQKFCITTSGDPTTGAC